MTRDVWLEVALNGPWGQGNQPYAPVAADDIVAQAIACIDAGAAIVHIHAYDPDTGRQRDAYELYAPLIERIRDVRDAIVYPTIPFAGSTDAAQPMTAQRRYEAVTALAETELVEWIVVDPGSVNLAHYKTLAPGGRGGFIYANPEDHIRHGLALCEYKNLTPSYAIYEPGFVRLGAALHRLHKRSPLPVYRFMLSEDMAFGFPPEEYALDAYLNLLAGEAIGAAWMVAGLGVEIGPLIAMTVREGGHVRVGLEDAPLGCRQSNVDLVLQARRQIEAAGGRLASPAAIRQAQARPHA